MHTENHSVFMDSIIVVSLSPGSDTKLIFIGIFAHLFVSLCVHFLSCSARRGPSDCGAGFLLLPTG